MFGFGVVQSIDAASMDLFLSYKQFSGEAKLDRGGRGSRTVSADDFSAVIGGVKINF
jgi:hypothetical protein